MRTRVSTKGQVVIPRAVRDKLQLRPGDPLETLVEGDRIILIPTRKRGHKLKIMRDPATGLPVLTAGKHAPRLTSKRVAEILSEFP
jgi:AbrB family looped-hinge helix DNA binding protein